MVERRKYKRFQIKEKAFVRHAENVGRIVNLSMGGMLCECTADRSISPDSDGFGICYGDKQCPLGKIKVRRITQKTRNNTESESLVLTRKCGIQFEELSKEQSSELKKIISRFKIS